MSGVTPRKNVPSPGPTGRLGGWFTWALITGCGVWVSIFLAWQLLSSVNFAYGLIYDWADIDATITQYGPQNRYKRGLETTSREERERIFADIVTAINDDGRGLAQIRYRGRDGRDLGEFLRPPEVLHLQDVANLLATLRWWSYGALAGLGVGLGLAMWQRWRRPSAARTLLGVVVTALALGLGAVMYGPTELFYQWHNLVFPEGHEWFFYYQDSLMTTLMRAPVIFGYIAVLLVVCALVGFALLWWVMGWLLARQPRS